MAKRVPVDITDVLVALFKAAVPADQAIWEGITADKVMTMEERIKAHETVAAFDRAANVMPGSRAVKPASRRSPRYAARDFGAKLNEADRAKLKRFTARWWKHRYTECPHLRAIDAEDGRGP